MPTGVFWARDVMHRGLRMDANRLVQRWARDVMHKGLCMDANRFVQRWMPTGL